MDVVDSAVGRKAGNKFWGRRVDEGSAGAGLDMCNVTTHRHLAGGQGYRGQGHITKSWECRVRITEFI